MEDSSPERETYLPKRMHRKLNWPRSAGSEPVVFEPEMDSFEREGPGQLTNEREDSESKAISGGFWPRNSRDADDDADDATHLYLRKERGKRSQLGRRNCDCVCFSGLKV